MSRKYFIVPILMCSILTACGNNADDDQSSHAALSDSTSSVSTDARNMADQQGDLRDSLTKNIVSENATSTTLSADSNSSQMLFEAGSDVRNEWYYEQLENAGVQEERSTMIELRSEVCSQLTSGKTIDNIANDLTLKNYTAHQQGVIIASSMISQCSDSPVIVDQDMANNIKSTDKK